MMPVSPFYKKIFFNGFFLFAAALTVRLVFCFILKTSWYHTDSKGYFDQADTIAAGGWGTVFPNGYPLLIFIVKLLSGGDHIEAKLIFINCLLSSFNVLFIFLVAKKIIKSPVLQFIVGAIMVIYPNQLNYTGQLLSEVMCLFFLAGAYYSLSKEKMLVAGVLGGVATITRSTSMFMIIFIVALLFFTKHKRTQSIKLLMGMLSVLLLYASVNKVINGKFALNGNTAMNIEITSQSHDGIILFDLPKTQKETTTGEALKKYFGFMVSEPSQFFKDRWLYFKDLWLVPKTGVTGTEGVSRSVVASLLIALRIPFFILSTIAFFFAVRSNETEIISLYFPVLIITVFHTLLFSTPRFSFVAEPFAILLSFWFIEIILNHNKINSRFVKAY